MPSDAILRRLSWSTQVQVMACCLTAPRHDLKQFWLHQSDSVPFVWGQYFLKRYLSHQSAKWAWKLIKFDSKLPRANELNGIWQIAVKSLWPGDAIWCRITWSNIFIHTRKFKLPTPLKDILMAKHYGKVTWALRVSNNRQMGCWTYWQPSEHHCWPFVMGIRWQIPLTNGQRYEKHHYAMTSPWHNTAITHLHRIDRIYHITLTTWAGCN